MARTILKGALLAALVAAVQPATTAAQDVLFLSTQLRPVEEATKMRQAILKGAGPVTFVVEEPPQFTVRMQAETEAGKRTVSLVGALHGEIGPLVPMGALQPIDDVAAKLAGRGIPASLMQLGKLGTPNQQYIPWMQATYVMAAHKSALAHLPAGADINALTYDQLTAWAKAVTEKTGKRAARLPGGAEGAHAPLLPGLLLPVLHGRRRLDLQVGGRGGRLGEAQGALAAREPQLHQLRLHAGAPARRRGADRLRSHRAVEGRAGGQAERLRHLPGSGRPQGPRVHAGGRRARDPQGRAQPGRGRRRHRAPDASRRRSSSRRRRSGSSRSSEAELPATLSPGVKLLASAVGATSGAKDALPSLLPIGLGAKGGEFNKVYMDAFQRIVLRGEPIKDVLAAQAKVLDGLMQETKAPCWAPDKPSTGPCPVN